MFAIVAMSDRKVKGSARARFPELAAQEPAVSSKSGDPRNTPAQGAKKSTSVSGLLQGNPFRKSISPDVQVYASSPRNIVDQSVTRMDIRRVVSVDRDANLK